MSSNDAEMSDPQTSKVKEVLAEGRKQLWNAEWPSYVAFVVDPVRDFLIDPAFQIATVLLPPICVRIPHCDGILASFVQVVIFRPMRGMYLLADKSSEDDYDLRRTAKNDILVTTKASLRVPRFRPPSNAVSAVRGAIAFTSSVTADLIGAIIDRKKMKKWFEALTEFKAYLDASGVGSELEEAMMKPLLRGRLLDNVKILNDIQEKLYTGRSGKLQKFSSQEVKGPVEEGKRMMRFATAAYGTEMIRSALDREARPQELENQKKAIAFHAGVKEQDLVILYVEDGGSMKVLRHFVAIDHDTKSVVLALRGTLSISGALTDMKAMDCDFCFGKAHKGIAEMANNVWYESGDKILKLFEDQRELLKDFSFVVTGHSLGAGTACLLNIKCHVEQLLGERPVRCFGFAPPPTYFCPQDSLIDPTIATRIEQATDNSLCFIHDNDCVPLLSVVSIRRLATLMDAVDNETEHMWAVQRFKIFWEWQDIPAAIFQAVLTAEMGDMRLAAESSTVASKLRIPARLVVWMKKNFAGSFDAIGCSPSDVADMNVFVCQDMITDHMPEQYEDALDAFVEGMML